MSLEVRIVGILISLETRSLYNHLQDTTHVSINYTHVEFARLESLHDSIILLVKTRLKHIIAGNHLSHCILAAEPVSHDHAFESPFVTENRSLEFTAL